MVDTIGPRLILSYSIIQLVTSYQKKSKLPVIHHAIEIASPIMLQLEAGRRLLGVEET